MRPLSKRNSSSQLPRIFEMMTNRLPECSPYLIQNPVGLIFSCASKKIIDCDHFLEASNMRQSGHHYAPGSSSRGCANPNILPFGWHFTYWPKSNSNCRQTCLRRCGILNFRRCINYFRQRLLHLTPSRHRGCIPAFGVSFCSTERLGKTASPRNGGAC